MQAQLRKPVLTIMARQEGVADRLNGWTRAMATNVVHSTRVRLSLHTHSKTHVKLHQCMRVTASAATLLKYITLHYTYWPSVKLPITTHFTGHINGSKQQYTENELSKYH